MPKEFLSYLTAHLGLQNGRDARLRRMSDHMLRDIGRERAPGPRRPASAPLLWR